VIETAGSAEAPPLRKLIARRPLSAARRFYRECLLDLSAGGFEVLVGGGYALERYLGAGRSTKDLDLFVHPRDVERLLEYLSACGYRTERVFPHWLAKVRRAGEHIDVIFDGGNGACPVDDEWLRHGVPSEVLGVDVQLCPPEEMIWSKAFVMERERYDGADVAHLLRALADRLDWARLARRFGKHWHVLYAHLILFTFIYPSERHRIPARVMRRCAALIEREARAPADSRICRGTLVSRAQYLIDTKEWGYEDARLAPLGAMSEEEASIWTAAIDEEASRPLAAPPAEPADADPAR
jgi:Uncharacterised nucleotidyltransferase